MRPTLIIAAGFALLPILSGPAWTQANRTFVSGRGFDSNPCSLGAPCRSFAQALTQTNAGGEITVLDSAGYGTLVIGKSITITSPGGVEAGVTAAAGQTAIAINSSSSIVVTLRGLTLQGGGFGQNGIVLESTASGTLNIIDCVVQNFAGAGIAIMPALSSNIQPSNVLIADSFVLNNAGSGIEISPQTGNTTVLYAIDHTTVAGNNTSDSLGAGILVDSSAGNLAGSLSSVHAHMNLTGVKFIGDAFIGDTRIKNSVLDTNNSDLTNDSSGIAVSLYANQINNIMNNNTIFSDGTNDIGNVSGSGLTTISRR